MLAPAVLALMMRSLQREARLEAVMDECDASGEREGAAGRAPERDGAEDPKTLGGEHDEAHATPLYHTGEGTRRSVLTTPVTVSGCRRFFSVNGGSVLYCLSALSILYGISQIVGPVLATTEALGKTLPCIGALNVYELALLGVLALIVAWRNVTDDATSLVVLIALFLIASGITLASVANDNPNVAVLVGAGSCALVVGKLWVLRRTIRLRLERLQVAGLGILLAWNFFMSSAMALMVKHDLGEAAIIRRGWLVGWLVMLAGGVLLVVHAARAGSGEAKRRDTSVPFLRTPGMAWVFAAVVLLAANVHQYALTFIFDVRFAFGDFLPVIIVAAVLALELMRIFGKTFGAAEVVVSVVPLAAGLVTVLTRSFVDYPRVGLELLWYPPVLLGVAAGAMLWAGLRNGWWWLLYVAFAHAMGIVLTAGVRPDVTAVAPPELNWETFLAVAGLSLFGLGLARRRAPACMAGVAVLSVWAGMCEGLRDFADLHDVPMASVIGLVAGLGTMAVYLVFPRALHRRIALLGAMILAASTVACFRGPSRLDYPIESGAVVAVLAGAVWLRTRDIPLTVVLCLPLVRGLYVSAKTAKGWRYVMLSFVLLVLGALISLRKGRRAREAGATDHLQESAS